MLENEVRIHRSAAKFLDKLSPKIRDALLKRLDELKDFPRIYHIRSVTRLRGSNELWFRMRVGEIRILFRWDKHRRIIFVEKIGWRENVYSKR